MDLHRSRSSLTGGLSFINQRARGRPLTVNGIHLRRAATFPNSLPDSSGKCPEKIQGEWSPGRMSQARLDVTNST